MTIGLYEPAIKPTEALADYPVLAAVESARKLVSCFFETDEQYLSNKPKLGLLFSATEADAQSYYQLINGGGGWSPERPATVTPEGARAMLRCGCDRKSRHYLDLKK